jgi:hypothetical protein
MTLTLVFTLALLNAVGSQGAAATPPIPQRQVTQGTCDPQLLALPGLTSTSLSVVAAMNDSGLVVGTSREPEGPSTVVVWTDLEHVTDTGLGGVVGDNQNTSSATAVDANEAGLVAINRTKLNDNGRAITEEAVVWSQDTGATVLPAPPFRPLASLIAINDEGDAIGHIRGRGHGSVPVIWKDGKRSRLPVPPHVRAVPADINNAGLVVGAAYGRFLSLEGAWWWRSGPSIRFLAPAEGTVKADATNVDNSGRIVGHQRVGPGDSVRTVLWRNLPHLRVGWCALRRATCTTAGTWRPSSQASVALGPRLMWHIAAPATTRGYRSLPTTEERSVGATSALKPWHAVLQRSRHKVGSPSVVTLKTRGGDGARDPFWTCTQTLL